MNKNLGQSFKKTNFFLIFINETLYLFKTSDEFVFFQLNFFNWNFYKNQIEMHNTMKYKSIVTREKKNIEPIPITFEEL